MTIRPYITATDYPVIKAFWEQTKEQPPAINRIPEESSFVIVDDNGTIMAMLTAYITNGQVAIMDNLIGNPDQKGNVRKKAIEELCNYTIDYVQKEFNCGKLLAFIKNKALVRYYKKFGFNEVEANLTCVARELSCQQ